MTSRFTKLSEIEQIILGEYGSLNFFRNTKFVESKKLFTEDFI